MKKLRWLALILTIFISVTVYGYAEDETVINPEEMHFDETQGDISQYVPEDAPEDSEIYENTEIIEENADGLEEAVDITKKCKLKCKSKSTRALTDGKISTVFGGDEDVILKIMLPKAETGYLYILWDDTPDRFELRTYDSEKHELAAITDSDPYFAPTTLFRIDSNVSYVTVHVYDQGIAELKLFSHGDVPDAVQNWLSPYESADMLVVAAHAGDEFGCFGGTIPYYQTVREKNVQLVYLCKMSRREKMETLSALWAAGVRHYPVFLNMDGSVSGTAAEIINEWGGEEKVIGKFVKVIRKLEPDVILTHASEGENGNVYHVIAGDVVRKAVQSAANASEYQDSTLDYGTWQVKKLYVHLGEEGAAVMDYSLAEDALGGVSPNEIAKQAFKNFSKTESGLKGNKTIYTLVVTETGEDVLQNDLFENIIEAYATAEPEQETEIEPTATPTLEPVLVFDIEQTPAPVVDTQKSAHEFSGAAAYTLKIFLIGFGAIAAFALIQVALYVFRRRRSRRYKG